MEKMTNDYSEINFHVCGTFNGIEDAVEKAEFSDAIIVNTLALKIAPDGLYKVLKSIEELGKDVYFILSGWESLPKNSELCKNKLAQIVRGIHLYHKTSFLIYNYRELISEIRKILTAEADEISVNIDNLNAISGLILVILIYSEVLPCAATNHSDYFHNRKSGNQFSFLNL